MSDRTRLAWTDELIGILKTRWAAGASASRIAAEIRVSRNAVIGKAHRLGLSTLKPRSTAAVHAVRPVRRPTPKPAKAPSSPPAPKTRKPQPEVLAAPSNPPVRLLDLTPFTALPGQCRWPVKTAEEGCAGGETLFCGAPKDQDKPYCPYHTASAFIRRTGVTWSEERLEQHRAMMRRRAAATARSW